ncbi:MAG: ABC transporter substrate-binding protein [Rhodospirillaceae bacterium]|nr:ABC transporter substrate-binding protein [Rhodospirillaceae bacterium]
MIAQFKCRAIAVAMLVALTAAGAQAAEKVLRIGNILMPQSVGNPYRTTGIPNIYTWAAMYDGLTRIDEQGRVQPWLATSWRNIDPLTWRITLRPNVIFSNGAPFNAEAVLSAVAYFQTPEAMRELVARELKFLKAARKIDELTVDLITDVPTPHLPRALPLFYMTEPGQWQALGPEKFAQSPVGTGPFTLERADVTGWKMRAFKQSWRAPKVDKLNWIVAPEAATRVQAVLANQMDIALNLGPDEVNAIEMGGGKGMHWRNASVWAINFHTNKDTPLKDARVRQAINYAVDREGLVQGLLEGATAPATQAAPPTAYGYDTSIPPIPYDPQTAKKLLAEAGYPNGFKFVVQAVVGSGPADGAVYQKVAQDLSVIGITMEIRQFPVSELLRNAVDGAWDGDAFGMTYSTEPTIDVVRAIQSHSCLWVKPWYCDERIMPAIRKAMTTFDEAEGLKARHEVMQFYRKEYAALFLYDLPRFAGMRANVTGFQELHGFINLDRIDLN